MYKNGQGGITKATVSITFDNSNKSQSPLGFETHDEITVTRQVSIEKAAVEEHEDMQEYELKDRNILSLRL